MSGCLGPPLPVYSSPLVIYSSPLVIYSCRLLDAFIKGLFNCFIHMTSYFLSSFEHLAKIISEKLSVFFLNMFLHPIFSCKWLITCYTHSLFFSWGSLSSMSQYYFKWFMASCCSSNFNLGSFFTLVACSLSYFWLPFFIVFLLIFLISKNLFSIYSSFSKTIYLLYFQINL